MKSIKYSFFTVATVLWAVILLVIEPSSPFSLSDFLFNYESSFIEPLFYMTFSLSISSLLLIFLKEQFFKKWLKRILIWFLPLSLLVIASGTDGAQFGWMPKTTLAQIMGGVLVSITIVFVLVMLLKGKLKKKK